MFIIRRWNQSDISALTVYLNNKKIWDNCRDSLPYPYTNKDAEQFIQFVLNQEIQNDYCIEINQEAVGNISFIQGTDVDRYNVELGYWLAEPYWSQGIMTEALKRVISDFFLQTDIMRIYANVFAYNLASMRVLEKVGFRKCDIHQKACFKNKQFIDGHYYELLRSDFKYWR